MIKKELCKKEQIQTFVNANCALTACQNCDDNQIYGYQNCPFLKLKEIAMKRKVTIEDVTKELIEKNNEYDNNMLFGKKFLVIGGTGTSKTYDFYDK